jgi:hypothetical protein
MAIFLFAGIPVRDFAVAVDWYERLFGAPPSSFPHDTEAVWELARRPALRIDCSPVVARGQEYAPRVSLLGIAVESLQSGVVIRLTTPG